MTLTKLDRFSRWHRISLISLLFFVFATGTSTAATYFSRATGPWNVNNTWSTTGFGGVAAGAVPTAGDIVNIGGGFTVFVTAPALCTTLNINDTGTLSLEGSTIIVAGITTVGQGVSGIVTTSTSGVGIKTFTGQVIISANATWNLSGQNPATSFGGGIVMGGTTFNNGTGAAAFSATQTLSGANNMTFGGTVTPAAATTLTNNNTGTVTVSGSIVLTGNFTQGTNSILALPAAAPFSGAGTFDATTNANTVNYTGAAQTVKPVSYRTLGLSGSGVKTVTGVTTVGTNFNMSGSATATTVITTIGGNVSITGTAVMTTGSICAVTGSLTVGAGATLSMGSFAFSIGTTSSITGTVNTVTGNAGLRTFTGTVTLNAGGVWNLSGQQPASSFGGGVTMNGTTFNNGTGAAAFTATQTLQGGSNIIFGGTITLAAATTLTNNNTATVTIVSITLTGNFTQGAASTLALPGATPFTGAGTFDASTNANTVNYTGAAQTVKPVTYHTLGLSGSGVKTMTGITAINTDFNVGGTASVTAAAALTIGGNVTLTAGTFIAGAFTHNIAGNWVNNGGAFTNTNSTINMNGTTQSIGGTSSTTFNNLTIAGAGTTTLTRATTIGGNITLTSGTLTAGAFTHNLAGNWVNNGGAFVNTNSTINMNGTTQSVGGTSSTTFNNLTIASSGTTTLTVATFVGGTFDIEGGTVVNLNGVTTHTANQLNLDGNGQAGGTWGGTGSGAINISSLYFTAGAGRITISVSTTQALPYIEPFDGEVDGSISNATPPWNVTQAPSSGTFSKESPVILLGGEGLEVNNTGAIEGVWQTADLDIGAGVAEVGITLDVTVFGTNVATDYVKVLYVWDGGASASEVLVATVTATTTSPLIIIPAVGHSKIRLVIRAKDNTNGTFLGIPFEFAIDNINIIPIRTLYSRQSTAWGTSGTWSTVAINGVDCACTPSAAGYDKIFIGGNRTVTLAANGAASNLTVFGAADIGGAGTLGLNTFSLTLGLGAAVTVNNGGIINSSAGSALIFSDNQAHTITANGSISAGSMTINNSAQYTANALAINGTGAFTITGGVTVSTAFLGAETATTNMPMTVGGVVTVNFFTAFINNSTVTMGSTAANTITGLGTWTQSLNSTLDFAGASMNILTFTANSALNLVDYDRGGVQTIYNTNYWNLTLSNSGAKTLGGNITLRGNWNRTGTATLVPAGNRVTFNALAGTAAQSITAVGGETFADLTITSGFATSPQITLNNDVTVTGVLAMNSGNINLNTHLLSLTSAASASLTHPLTSGAGWAFGGSIERSFPATAIGIINEDGFLPIGTATSFRPFFFGKSNTGGSSGTITLTHTDPGTATTGLSIADTGPVATIITRDDAVWGSTLTGGTGATFGIRYGGTGLGIVANLSHVRSMLLNSVIATHVAASTVSTSDPRVERSGLTVAEMTNNFYMGSTNAASSLPVSLVSFEGVAQSYGVELQWKTLSEINNDFFTILHSTGETEFVSIGNVVGSGTTNESHDYSLIHYKPVIGKNYYKLRQTDLDGHTSYQGLVMVEVFRIGGIQVSIYPNPVSHNRQFNVVVNGLEPQSPTEFEIIDMRGMVVKRGSGTADETGSIKASIEFAEGTPGIYLLRFPGGQFKFAIE